MCRTNKEFLKLKQICKISTCLIRLIKEWVVSGICILCNIQAPDYPHLFNSEQMQILLLYLLTHYFAFFLFKYINITVLSNMENTACKHIWMWEL